jgi:hypothetical protein
VLFVTLYVWPAVFRKLFDYELSWHLAKHGNYFVIYPLTLVLLTVVWAITIRPQLERGRLSIAAIFGLVTIVAVGLYVASFAILPE